MKVEYKVIKRYFQKEEKKGDRELILKWFSDIGSESELRRYYKELWNKPYQTKDLDGYDESKILNSVYHKIKLEESVNINNKRYRFVFDMFSKVAAVLFIPLIIFVYLSRDQLFSISNQIAQSEIQSPLGVRTKFYLPDGSSGWLNGGSKINFPTEFKGKNREVSVSGEVYFEVSTDPKRPFLVKGPDILVTAYGTSFNINAYPGEPIKEIALIHGSIKVQELQNQKYANSAMLKPGQMYRHNGKNSTAEIITVDTNLAIAWTEGKMIFKDDPLLDVVNKLNHWFNADIQIKDKILESYTYMATFEDESLDEVLKLLKLSAPIYYKDLGRKMKADGIFEKRIIELYYNNR